MQSVVGRHRRVPPVPTMEHTKTAPKNTRPTVQCVITAPCSQPPPARLHHTRDATQVLVKQDRPHNAKQLLLEPHSTQGSWTPWDAVDADCFANTPHSHGPRLPGADGTRAVYTPVHCHSRQTKSGQAPPELTTGHASLTHTCRGGGGSPGTQNPKQARQLSQPLSAL